MNGEPLPWYKDPKIKLEISMGTAVISMIVNFSYSYLWSRALNEKYLNFCLNAATGRIGWIPKLTDFQAEKFPRKLNFLKIKVPLFLKLTELTGSYASLKY